MSRPPTPELIARLGSLPVHHDDEHWEVDLLGPPSRSDRPKAGSPPSLSPLQIAVCVSTHDAAAMVPPSDENPADDALALRAVAACALDPHAPGVKPLDYLPASVHVRALPPQALSILREALVPLGVSVDVKPSLPCLKGLEDMLAELTENVGDDDLPAEPPSALMLAPGMTLDRIRSFAQAGVEFFKAKPWALFGELLWEVRAPKAPPGLGYLTIMGSAAEVYGIAFFGSFEHYQKFTAGAGDPVSLMKNLKDPAWSVTFDEPIEAPPEDGVLWAREKLPLAGKSRIAVPIGIGPGPLQVRPDAATLAFLEGLLRALTLLTPARLEMTGVLEDTVPTADGPFHFVIEPVPPPDPREDRPAKPGAALQLKITIAESNPPIWRRLIIRNDATLEELHTAIQRSFGWADYHMHRFQVGKRRFSGEPPGGMAVDSMWGGGDDEPTDLVVLSELNLRAKSKAIYVYDFGDNWQHVIVVEKVLKGDEIDAAMSAGTGWKLNSYRPTPVAACVDGERAGPPEDCGGIPGYEETCRIMADPGHPEHAERKQWVASGASNSVGRAGFDPERFDRSAVNEKLKRDLKR